MTRAYLAESHENFLPRSIRAGKTFQPGVGIGERGLQAAGISGSTNGTTSHGSPRARLGKFFLDPPSHIGRVLTAKFRIRVLVGVAIVVRFAILHLLKPVG